MRMKGLCEVLQVVETVIGVIGALVAILEGLRGIGEDILERFQDGDCGG